MYPQPIQLLEYVIPPTAAARHRKRHVMVLARVMVFACVMVLACAMVLARVKVLARVMVLACDGWGRGSHGLSARRV